MITSAKLLRRPSLRFLLSHPAHFVALGFGAGLSPVAPGTFGTLLGLGLHRWLVTRLSGMQLLMLLGLMLLGGLWACSRTGRSLGVEDHGGIVWDEVTAFMLVLFFLPNDLLWQAWAFLLFRLFDVFKPGPVRAAEQRFRGGFGVMVDDLVAAFLALLCLTLFVQIVRITGI